MRESNERTLICVQEAKEGKIDLKDENPEVVDVMLHYFYHFDYSDEKEGGMAPILLDIYVFAMAEKYFVEPLQKLATEKFNARAYVYWRPNLLPSKIGAEFRWSEHCS